MRHTLRTLGLLVAAMTPAAALAGGLNHTYLVPAIKQCAGPATCVPREFASAYTFDAIILLSPAARYMSPTKPSLTLDIRGVRDASHALVTGSLTLVLPPSRVSLPTLGTFPDDSPFTQVAPVPIPIKNGGAKFPYKSLATIPNGLITNGGAVEVLDPDGKLLAVVGSQAKP